MTQRYGVETEADKSIRTTATTIARCRIKLYEGVCTDDDCVKCGTRNKAMHVYNTYSDVDRLAIDNTVEDIIGNYHSSERSNAIKREGTYVPILLGLFLGLILICTLLTCGAAYPCKSLDSYHRYRFVGEPDYKEEYRKAIYDCLLETSKVICDINKDGLINCQDWSILYYRLWKDNYIYPCEMVLNVNEATDMNHMFIAVKYAYISQWEYIEPQAFKDSCNRSYFMEDYWGSKYNPLFNKICTDYLYNKYFIQKRRM